MAGIDLIMSIHIGDKLGLQFEYYRYYLPFVFRTHISYVKPRPMETVINRQYEIFNDFIPHKNDVVIDVGAFYGDYSIIWNKLYGANVIAFEPLFINYMIARANIFLNNADVILTNYAIGNKDETVVLNGNSMINNFNSGLEQICNMITLDNILYLYMTERVDLIKIDIEGFELEALVGAEKTLMDFKPKLILETHTSDLKRIAIRYLRNLGYELKHIGREHTGSGAMDLISEMYFEPEK